MGEIATAAAFFTYFVIMEVYGFSPNTLFFLLTNDPMLPIDPTNVNVINPTTINYTFQDPSNANFTYNFVASDNVVNSNGLGFYNSNTIAAPSLLCGNANNKNNAFSGDFPNWLSTINGQIDLRGFYVSCQQIGGVWSYKRVIPDMP